MKTFAEAEQVLAAALEGYESRPNQQALARAVEGVFANEENFRLVHPDSEAPQPVRKHLFGQAGCGCGKSLGYLIPAVLSGKRVVVTVTTKALQTQLAEKDLPFLQAHLGVPFTWAVLKGRANYFCAQKAAEADESEVPMLAQVLKESAAPGFEGLRESFSVQFTDAQWSKVCAETEECNANDCKDHVETCFAEAARARAKEAQIVVVNHALFFTDLVVKVDFGIPGMLDEYDLVIFDEAHEAAEVAGNTLGGQFSEGTIRSLAAEVRSWAVKFADEGEEPFSAGLAGLMSATERLFAAMPGEQSSTTRLRAKELDDLADHLAAVFSGLVSLRETLALSRIERAGDYTRAKKRKERLTRRANATIARLSEIVTADFATLVRWVEVEKRFVRGQWETRKVIKTAPVDVAPYLREHLFSQTPAIMVSATMAVKGSFAFIASRLGVDNYDGLDVGSPFDFGTQSRLYVPTHLPEPIGRNIAEWEAQATEEIVDLIRASHGRALVLFTSVKHMKAAFASVQRRVPYAMKMQGQESVRDLAAWFAAETHGVLFGTKSFFTGFDVQGESLVNVIIAKLPFPVPTEPLTEARCEAIEAAGGNAFGDYTIPVMSLVLQQAAGRLIRHTGDKGVVAILDPRMLTKGYGKQIVRDLPPMPVVTKLADAEAFFAEVNAHFGSVAPAQTTGLAF